MPNTVDTKVAVNANIHRPMDRTAVQTLTDAGLSTSSIAALTTVGVASLSSTQIQALTTAQLSALCVNNDTIVAALKTLAGV